MRKRWISMLLALCLCIGVLSAAASAAGETRTALPPHVTDGGVQHVTDCQTVRSIESEA